jgi:hypothetical protein
MRSQQMTSLWANCECKPPHAVLLLSRRSVEQYSSTVHFKSRTGDTAYTDLNSVCYNSLRERGQTLGFAVPVRRFWTFSLLSIYCPFDPRKWIYSMDGVEAGETVDSKSRQ